MRDNHDLLRVYAQILSASALITILERERGQTFKQIGKTLGRSEATAKYAYERAIRKVRAHLDSGFDGLRWSTIKALKNRGCTNRQELIVLRDKSLRPELYEGMWEEIGRFLSRC